MNNFTKRILSGSVYVSVLVFSILYSKITFLSLFFILMLFCLYEFLKIIKLNSIFPYFIAILAFIFGNILNVEDVPSKIIFQYVGIILFLTILNNDFSYAINVILGVFILIWSSDTFAYLIGKNFGKIKLLKRISPNKTVEGFIGGMIASLITSYLLAHYFTVLSLTHWIVIALLVGIFGVL